MASSLHATPFHGRPLAASSGAGHAARFPPRSVVWVPARRAAISTRAMDNETLVGLGVGLAGIVVGVAVPLFYEIQVKGSEKRDNDQPCFPCQGTGAQSCRFCRGKGLVVVDLGGEEESSKCVNCEGRGAITCTTCKGTGVQPRYLDRREFKDDD